MRSITSLLLALALLSGPLSCGDEDTGETGVPGSKQVGQLTTDELKSVCDWVVGVQGGATKTCPGDVSIHLVSADDCFDHLLKYYKTCGLTVSQTEACATAVGADPCTGFGTADCAEARACSCEPNCPTAAAFP